MNKQTKSRSDDTLLTVDFNLRSINERIVAFGNQKMSLDVETGKMGFCLYFFGLSRLSGNREYKNRAEKLLDAVYSELGAESAVRSAYELAQIGWSMDYLLKQKYVGGNINFVLGDIDRLIFKAVVFDKTPVTYRLNGIFFILYFICMRIEEQKKGSEERFILEELCIKLVNELYRSFDAGFYDEPYRFNLADYKLPQFLFAVSKIYSLEFYNYRINEILHEISRLIQSRMPALHSNRLFLLWSLAHLKQATGREVWDEQTNLLANHIDYQKIIYTELRSKNVFLLDGVSGIYLLLNALKDTPYPIPFDKTLFRKRIEDSEIWKDEEALDFVGLVNGFSGLLWVYNTIINEI